jgi:hypothetical protein
VNRLSVVFVSSVCRPPLVSAWCMGTVRYVLASSRFSTSVFYGATALSSTGREKERKRIGVVIRCTHRQTLCGLKLMKYVLHRYVVTTEKRPVLHHCNTEEVPTLSIFVHPTTRKDSSPELIIQHRTDKQWEDFPKRRRPNYTTEQPEPSAVFERVID